MTDELTEVKRLMAWVWLTLGACVMILMVDLLLKKQIGRMAVRAAEHYGRAADGTYPVASPADGGDIGSRRGSDHVDGNAAGPPVDDGADHEVKMPPRTAQRRTPGRPPRDVQ